VNCFLNWRSGTVVASPTGDVPAQSPSPMEAQNESPPRAPRPLQPIEASTRGASVEAHSRFLHIVEQGAVLRLSGSRLLVTRKDKVLLEVPQAKLQGVLVYGNVQITTQCMRELLSEGVWVSLFSRQGVYRGRLQPPAERGGRLRLRQWERSRDPQYCLEFARSAVRGKVRGALALASLRDKDHLAETLGEGRRILRESLERAGGAESIEQLRGIEGTAARAYFDLFRRWNLSEMPFEGREKRGTSSPVNALLNFGYTLLTRELEGLVEAAGLDPTVGLYHAPDGDRPSLACDFVEEFRHPVIDRLVLRLINLKRIQPDDFVDREEKGGLRMSPAAMRRFLTDYETALVGEPRAEAGGASAGFRAVFLRQLARLLDSLATGDPYRSHLEPEPCST
jgi:CRISPR-associated protein Cas1